MTLIPPCSFSTVLCVLVSCYAVAAWCAVLRKCMPVPMLPNCGTEIAAYACTKKAKCSAEIAYCVTEKKKCGTKVAYAGTGTELAYGGRRTGAPRYQRYQPQFRARELWPYVLALPPYALPGTDLTYAATSFCTWMGPYTSSKTTKRYTAPVSSYAPAMRCPVLTQRMMLSAY
eukprot:994243-Rhodomonas_salina.3